MNLKNMISYFYFSYYSFWIWRSFLLYSFILFCFNWQKKIRVNVKSLEFNGIKTQLKVI